MLLTEQELVLKFKRVDKSESSLIFQAFNTLL